MTGNKRSRGRDDPRDDESRKKRRDGRSRSSSPEILPRSDLQGNSRSVTRTTQKKEMAFEKSIRAIQDGKVEIPPITMKLDSYELPAKLYTGHDVFQITSKDPNSQYIFAKIPDLTQRGPSIEDWPFTSGYREERARVESRRLREKKKKTCELCKQHNHETKHCHYIVDPKTRDGVPLGFTPVCPYHNTSGHTIDDCDSLPLIMKDRKIAYRVFVQDRQDLPPILTCMVNWPDLADEFNHDGSGPWQPKFALEQWETPEVMENYWDRTPIVDPETEDLARILTLGPQTPSGASPDLSLDDLKKYSTTTINQHRSERVSGTSSRPSQRPDGLNAAERWSPVVMLKSAFPDGEGIEEMLADAKTRFDQTADKVVADDPSSNEGNPLYKACLRRWRLYPTQLISFDNGLVFANTTDSALPKETTNTAWKQTWCRELRKVILHPVWSTSIHFLLLSLQFTIMCRTDDRRSWQPCWDVDPKFGQYYEELDDAQVSPRQIPRCIKARYRNHGQLIPIICQVFVAIARQAHQTYNCVDAIERDDSQPQSFPRGLNQLDLSLLSKALDGMREGGVQRFVYNTANAPALFHDSREGHRNNKFDFPRKDNGEYLQARRHAYEQLMYRLVAHEKKVEQGTWTLREAMRNLPPDRSMLIKQDIDYVESDASNFPDEEESDLGVEETPPPRRRGMDNRQITEKARERRELDQGHDDAMDTSDGGMDRSS